MNNSKLSYGSFFFWVEQDNQIEALLVIEYKQLIPYKFMGLRTTIFWSVGSLVLTYISIHDLI